MGEGGDRGERRRKEEEEDVEQGKRCAAALLPTAMQHVAVSRSLG
jgi:hypothetical protein